MFIEDHFKLCFFQSVKFASKTLDVLSPGGYGVIMIDTNKSINFALTQNWWWLS